MVNFCAVVGCGHRGDRDKKSFYRLPAVIAHQGDKTQELSCRRRHLWLTRISREDLKESNHPHIRVCSDHFVSGKPADLYDETNPDWAPSLKLGHNKMRDAAAIATPRYERKVKRTKNICEQISAEVLLDQATGDDFEAAGVGSVEVQTELTGHTLFCMQSEINRLMEENRALRAKVDELMINEECFRNDNEKVKFYTGLPNFLILMHVFNFVSPSLSCTWRSSLTKFQQFIVTLMRCRLDLNVQDLAYRFSVSASTISRYFRTTMDIMHAKLSFLIKWPSREELRKTMPMSFQVNFGKKVAVIIDCFEVFTDRPSNLMARAQTWSSYKHHNTVKFLIGITPQGVISYISPAWGGRVSDKYLTENCGFLENILPGDVVLADRGFDISDSVGIYCAEVKIPAFLRGKKQLSMSEVIDTRKIANVRIHVERVIGCVRQKYSILNGPIPLDFLTGSGPGKRTLIDKIAVVCCALTNLSPSVVQFD